MNRPDADQLYHTLLNSGRLAKLRRLTYRCHSDRCLLLDALETPVGILLHQKRYKYSDAENLARSNEAGRARSTYDGNNHWMPSSYYLSQSALKLENDALAGQSLTCDHVLDHVLKASTFHQDWESGTGEIRVRSDASRYAL